jgi:hypothetical protein
MTTDAPSAEKRTGHTYRDRGRVRPHHVFLGIDANASHHIYQTTTETIHIVHEDGSRGRRLLDGGDLDDYMSAVDDARGWAHRSYGKSCVDMLVDAVD